MIDNEVSSKRVNGLHNSIPRPSFGTAVSTCFSGQSNSTVTCFRQWANVKLEGPIDAVGKVSSLSFVSHLYVVQYVGCIIILGMGFIVSRMFGDCGVGKLHIKEEQPESQL